MTSPVHTKEGLRRIALGIRDSLSQEEREANALFMRDRFLKALKLPPKAVISAYMPIQSEINATPLAEALLGRGYRVLMPVTPENLPTLEFRNWTPETPMLMTPQGIPEPDPAHAAAYIPDVLILPLLAFDGKGNRLGYGTGSFDQTLRGWYGRIPFLTVGIAHEAQYRDEVPADSHDFPLDICITNDKVYQIRQNLMFWWL